MVAAYWGSGSAEIDAHVTISRPQWSQPEWQKMPGTGRLPGARGQWSDAGEKWRYANLPLLLNLHGQEDVDRYGGWDPSREVDDDFMAVLVKLYDEPCSQEQSLHPLVSASWYGDVYPAAARTVVNVAKSDHFTLSVRETTAPCKGCFKVWVVYADMAAGGMGMQEKGWPVEAAGYAVGFFWVTWEWKEGVLFDDTTKISPKAPAEPTGFDWRAWVGRRTKKEVPQGVPTLTNTNQR